MLNLFLIFKKHKHHEVFYELEIADDTQLRFFDGNSTDAPEILPSAGLPFAIQYTAATSDRGPRCPLRHGQPASI